MKAVEAIVVLVVIGGLALIALVLIGRSVGRMLRRRREQDAPWELTEHSDGEQLVVYAERPGENKLLIGAAPFAAIDFDSQVYELRSKGNTQVYVLNERNR